jgi:hypothetical protein
VLIDKGNTKLLEAKDRIAIATSALWQWAFEPTIRALDWSRDHFSYLVSYALFTIVHA